ncbi:MAG TPA: type II toxin-antitoxin system prevent-host-death family antitoxin [Solirubrobacterales bacterium]|jgi:prevent-host-death family protein|nr:type II toxin-antitoxin system prevent-host-death family antitoxin [Solirubrobacterales bacterium]
MATDVPQRELRNRTADLLRRVEAGERLRITVHGHPVAELVPIEDDYPRKFVPLKKFEEIAGILSPEEGRAWAKEIREIRDESGSARDPFEKYEEQRAEERDPNARGDQ